MRAATHRSPGAPPGSHGLAHRDPHPEGGEVRSLLSALRSSARAAPAHPTTLSSPSPLLRSSGPPQLTPAGCPGKSDALYLSLTNSLLHPRFGLPTPPLMDRGPSAFGPACPSAFRKAL